jgi:hypothetical protein
MRKILLLLSAALSGCATGPPGPSTQARGTRALCQQLAKVSASSPEQISGDYVDQCLIARGFPQSQGSSQAGPLPARSSTRPKFLTEGKPDGQGQRQVLPVIEQFLP